MGSYLIVKIDSFGFIQELIETRLALMLFCKLLRTSTPELSLLSISGISLSVGPSLANLGEKLFPMVRESCKGFDVHKKNTMVLFQPNMPGISKSYFSQFIICNYLFQLERTQSPTCCLHYARLLRSSIVQTTK